MTDEFREMTVHLQILNEEKTMKSRISYALVVLLTWIVFHADAAEKSKAAAYQSNRAVIVVTGMRLNEDPADYRKDLSIAEGAAVKVTARDGTTREKKTEAFSKAGKKGGEVHFTADFEVDLDASYAIAMTFKDGTVIRIENYILPKDWKTHFYFHSTVGTLSPSSILRIGEDTQTKLRCYVYALYPLENYHKLGGRQVQ
jgi:hypothetical protein